MSKKRIREFEEQGVSSFLQSGLDIRLDLNCMNHATGITTNVAITFSDISNLKITGDLAPTIGMLRKNGENIHFELSDKHCVLIIVWRELKGGALPAITNCTG